MGERPTEGVNLSGDRKIENCDRIALRRSSPRASAEGAKRQKTVNLSGKRTENASKSFTKEGFVSFSTE